jgi:hypothetical protein
VVNTSATPTDECGVTPTHQELHVLSPMTLLENGIPLSLLLDLVCGPESADLISQEHRSD